MSTILIYVNESATVDQQKMAETLRASGKSVQIRNGVLFNGVEPGVEAVYAADFPGIADAYKEAGVSIASDTDTEADDVKGKSAAAPGQAKKSGK